MTNDMSSGKKSFTRMLLVPESQFKKLLNGSENTEKATISSVNEDLGNTLNYNKKVLANIHDMH